jgi:Zn-dependent metalloprotease
MHSSSRVRYLAVLSPLAFAFAAMSAQAAHRVDLQKQDVAQVYRQYKAATQRLGVPAQSADRHAELLSLDADSGLKLLNSAVDRDGSRHYRYQQTFRGIPVFGEQVIVSERKDGAVRNLFGRKLELIPTVAEADVELVFDPPWNRNMMSEAARLETGML